MNRRPVLAAVVAIVISLAGCGGTPQSKTAAPTSPAQAKRQTAAAKGTTVSPKRALSKVKLQLSWIPSPSNAPFFVAQAKGYYRQAGLDVTIVPGRSQNLAAQLVGKGGPIFAEASVPTMFLAISKGIPDRVVATYMRQSPLAFIYHKTKGFKNPRSLLGRQIVVSPGVAPWTLLPVVLHRYNVKRSELKVDFVQPNEWYPAFVKSADVIEPGQIDGAAGTKELMTVPDAGYRLYSDFGLNMYDVGLITNTTMIQDHPNEVRAFVAASTKGWQDVVSHPGDAVAAVSKDTSGINKQAFLYGVKLVLKLLYSAHTKGKSLGWMDSADIQDQVHTLHQYLKMPLKPIGRYYTNGFVNAG